MKFKLACACAVLVLAISGTPAFARGCLKGAFVGGVVGHYAGHHGTVGALAGCAYGHHRATVRQREIDRHNGQGASAD